MDYRKHLEEKFTRYQAILGDRADDNNEDRIDLGKIAQDYCCIDEDGMINIERIPIDGANVYFTVYPDRWQTKDTPSKDILVPLSQVSEKQLEHLVEVMRKAMIIEELRNTYLKYETTDC
jgi:hypothetical protein